MATEIISTIVNGFTGITSGIASAVADTFSSLVMNSEGGLNELGVWGLVLLSVGFGFGLLKKFTSIID